MGILAIMTVWLIAMISACGSEEHKNYLLRHEAITSGELYFHSREHSSGTTIGLNGWNCGIMAISVASGLVGVSRMTEHEMQHRAENNAQLRRFVGMGMPTGEVYRMARGNGLDASRVRVRSFEDAWEIVSEKRDILILLLSRRRTHYGITQSIDLHWMTAAGWAESSDGVRFLLLSGSGSDVGWYAMPEYEFDNFVNWQAFGSTKLATAATGTFPGAGIRIFNPHKNFVKVVR